MLDSIVVAVQVILFALLAWGGWLCLFGTDRRQARNQGAVMAGGRRRGDSGRRLADNAYAAPEGGVAKVSVLRRVA